LNAVSASTPSLERRRERRVPIHLPIVVRGIDLKGVSFEERTSSENLCRGGAAFVTRYRLNLGSQLEIKIPVPPTAASQDVEFSTRGRIVHLKKGSNERELIVGVEFTGPRFNRIFVSEGT